MNENDSERIAGALAAAGSIPADSLEESDIIVVNTCAVREKSVEKVHSLLGRLQRLKQKRAVTIGVVGCVAQLYQEQILGEKPFVDFILGPDNYWKIPDMLNKQFQGKYIATEWYRDWHEISDTKRARTVTGFITIMEGCNNFCAYCVVPYARGREKFRPASNILAEANEMAQQGYKEIQLLGQNVNSYKDPKSGQDFADLLQAVNAVEGIDWIRFITSHPKDFSPRLAQAMSSANKVCHQLHLPIQAGADSVLQRMNRGYTRQGYLDIIKLLRELMPDIALSTDIIVGFPGESEKDFDQTLEVLREVRFTNIFSFRYSLRPKTSAAQLEDNVTFADKKKRLLAVQSLQKQIQLEMNAELVGKAFVVLCEGKSKKDPDIYAGRNQAYQVINFPSPQDVHGQFVQVEIVDYGPYSLKAKLLS